MSTGIAFGNPHSHVACVAGHTAKYRIPATQQTCITITSVAVDPQSGQVHGEPGDVISQDYFDMLLGAGCEFSASFAPYHNPPH